MHPDQRHERDQQGELPQARHDVSARGECVGDQGERELDPEEDDRFDHRPSGAGRAMPS
jgi:hypothetical protein